jgi:hypothetical protein
MDNIIENNLLIAQFMGGKLKDKTIISIDQNEIWLPYHGVCRFDRYGIGSGKSLLYHTSWDWLIPVAIKCRNTMQFHEKDHPDEIKNMAGWFGISLTTLDIERIYNSIIEFINWFNTNIQNNETN